MLGKRSPREVQLTPSDAISNGHLYLLLVVTAGTCPLNWSFLKLDSVRVNKPFHFKRLS